MLIRLETTLFFFSFFLPRNIVHYSYIYQLYHFAVDTAGDLGRTFINKEATTLLIANTIKLDKAACIPVTVCKRLFDRSAKTIDTDEIVCIAMNARLDQDSFVKFLITIDEMCNKAGFNDKDK